jgi:hypothetical protein
MFAHNTLYYFLTCDFSDLLSYDYVFWLLDVFFQYSFTLINSTLHILQLPVCWLFVLVESFESLL